MAAGEAADQLTVACVELVPGKLVIGPGQPRQEQAAGRVAVHERRERAGGFGLDLDALEAFETARNRASGAIKVVLEP